VVLAIHSPKSFDININVIFYARIINNTANKLLKNNKTNKKVHMPPIHPRQLRKISYSILYLW